VNFLKLVVGFDVTQAVGFIPAVGEDIEADLTTNGVREVHVGKLLLEILDHFLPHFVFNVVFGEHIPLLPGALSPNGAHIHHAISELDEGSPLDGHIQFG